MDKNLTGSYYLPGAPFSSSFWPPNVATPTLTPPGIGISPNLGSVRDEVKLVESYTAWASLRPGVPRCSAKARELFSLERYLTRLRRFVSQIDWLALDIAFAISVFDRHTRNSDHLSSSSEYHGRKRRRARPEPAGNYGVTASIFGPEPGMCIVLDHMHSIVWKMVVADTYQRFQCTRRL